MILTQFALQLLHMLKFGKDAVSIHLLKRLYPVGKRLGHHLRCRIPSEIFTRKKTAIIQLNSDWRCAALSKKCP